MRRLIKARGPLLCCRCRTPNPSAQLPPAAVVHQSKQTASPASTRRRGAVTQEDHALKSAESAASGRVNACEVCYFEAASLSAILVNSIFLAMYDPENPDSEHNSICNTAGQVLTIFFLVEMLCNMVDQGVCLQRDTYLRNGFWNWLDLVVVVTGMLDFLPGFDNQLGVLRTARLLRPLKAIGASKGLRQQVAVLTSREMLLKISNVIFLMLITFSVFAVIGVSVFAGGLHAQCYDDATLNLIDGDKVFPKVTDPTILHCIASASSH